MQVLFIHVFILLFWGLISGGLYPGGLYPGGLYLGAYKWGTTVYLGDYIYIYRAYNWGVYIQDLGVYIQWLISRGLLSWGILSYTENF